MPRVKKTIVTDKAEIQPIIPQEEAISIVTPVSTAEHIDSVKNEKNVEKVKKAITPAIQAPLTKIPKENFKQLYLKDTYWLENDIYQTMADITEGKKSAKAFIINQALKDYLQKNNIELKPLRAKKKKD